MRYEPIKKSIGRFFRSSVFLRKILYFLLDLLLLRSWHVRRAVRKAGQVIRENAAVLDAGSGFGQYTWRMSGRYSKWTITGIDINAVDVIDCNTFIEKTGRAGRVNFRTGDLTEINDRDLYDLVLTVDVMEHIMDDEKVLLNFYNALRNKGRLIISTPSDKGGSDVHDEEDNSFIDEHVRDGYGKEEIELKLKKAGFTRTDVLYTYGKPGRLSWILTMKYPVKMLNISYLFFIILPFYYIIVFLPAFFLNILDVNIIHKSGTGLLVIADK